MGTSVFYFLKKRTGGTADRAVYLASYYRGQTRTQGRLRHVWAGRDHTLELGHPLAEAGHFADLLAEAGQLGRLAGDLSLQLSGPGLHPAFRRAEGGFGIGRVQPGRQGRLLRLPSFLQLGREDRLRGSEAGPNHVDEPSEAAPWAVREVPEGRREQEGGPDYLQQLAGVGGVGRPLGVLRPVLLEHDGAQVDHPVGKQTYRERRGKLEWESEKWNTGYVNCTNGNFT